MKRLLVPLISLLAFAVQGQDSINFLLNKGVVTYVDRRQQGNYAVSFIGDTVRGSGIPMVYVVDSIAVQIRRFRIPKQMRMWKYDPTSERQLLTHFHDYEFEYQRDTVFVDPIVSVKEFFVNQYGKQFLLWHFKMPDALKNEPKESISDGAHTYDVGYQTFLLFTTDEYVAMIGIPAYDGQNMTALFKYIKKDIASSVRIYDGDMNLGALNNQMKHQLSGTAFVIDAPKLGASFVVPFWLNIHATDEFLLAGSFPDLHNVSNALIFLSREKAQFKSFDDFVSRWANVGGVRKSKELKGSTALMRRYHMEYDGGYEGQVVFVDLKGGYGVISFMATNETYKGNVGRFDEFIKNFRIH